MATIAELETKIKSLEDAISEAVTSQLTGKTFWKSKTFWVNIVATAAVVAQMKWGFIVGPELQALGLSVVNLILRNVTKEPIVW